VNEHEAILRLKRGDMKALAFLVERYQLRAVRTAYLITQDRALAEDVVQAAFIKLHQGMSTFDPERPFAPWFMRSVVNAAIQAAQRRERVVSLDTDDTHDAVDALKTFASHLEDGLEAKEMRQAVQEALQKLSPEQRSAIVMRYYLDLSESEMVTALDIPAGTVKWRLHTARNQLRVLLRHIFQEG
jgi:RNA polymerase sigma-70 factor (ECF subfamily)